MWEEPRATEKHFGFEVGMSWVVIDASTTPGGLAITSLAGVTGCLAEPRWPVTRHLIPNLSFPRKRFYGNCPDL